MDAYWGGSERRITGITLRIITVNFIALIILLVGIFYLGQYQSGLINARLHTFQSELELISGALSEAALTEDPKTKAIAFKTVETSEMVKRLAKITRQRIRIFDIKGALVLDSRALAQMDDRIWAQADREKTKLRSIDILQQSAKALSFLIPSQNKLKPYPEISNAMPSVIPDIAEALNEHISLSAWRNEKNHAILSAAAPLFYNSDLGGAVLLTRQATQIEEDIQHVWVNVIKVFLGTLLLTIMLSIYLSGQIARPLKKLALAAENVRRGKAGAYDIPDFSARHDEIGELSIALRQMTLALSERMDTIQQFAADVAHELKNPLTSLKSAVETAAIVKKPTDQKKLMDIIKHDIERLDRLITDISSASRIDSELSRENFEKVDCAKLLSNLLAAYSKDPMERINHNQQNWIQNIQAENAKITLQNLASQGAKIWGMEGRLAQVFQNILSNALSFAPKDSTISILIVEMDDTISIIIEDQGRGIPPNKLDDIFERFYSERPEHEDYGRHSGLGLSICKQIINAHGGEIFAENVQSENVKSADDKTTGARFTIILNKV